jgi:hypothetical protein
MLLLSGVVLWHIQFQVRSSHDYANPFPPISDFVGLQTNLRILPHPLVELRTHNLSEYVKSLQQ